MKDIHFKFRHAGALLIAIILLAGGYSLMQMKTGLFPDITFPKIKIIAENGEQPIDKMLVTVTVPLENAIKKVENLSSLQSATSRGSCEISAFMDWNSDIDLAKQQVEGQIAAIQSDLPPGIKVIVEKMNPSILSCMGFSIEGKNRSPIELRELAEFTVKPILSRVPGVSDVAVIGGKLKEYQVVFDPVKLSNLHLTPQNIADVFQQSDFVESNGYVVGYNRLYLMLTDASVTTIEQLGNTPVVNTPTSKVLLKDIAQITIGEQQEFVRINANGKDVPLIAITKQPSANLIEVVQNVQEQLKELKRVLPPDVELKPYYNQADFVHDAIGSLKDVLWIGLLLSILVTILFLRSLKASTVILITIPITLALTFVLLYVLNYTFNIMTFGAIAAAIGLIIDDAIVVVEQIHRTHEENPDEDSIGLVGKAVHYLFPAMVGSSLSTIVIFLPFVLMSDVAGAYFKVLSSAMVITLISSFVVTWLGLPIVYLMLTKDSDYASVPIRVTKRRNWVQWFITRPLVSIVFVALLILATGILLPKLRTGFLPEMDEGSIVLDFDSMPGTSLDETDRMMKQVDSILIKTPEVDNFSRRLGTQMGFFITEPNRGDYLIQLKKKRSKTTEAVSDDIRKQIETTIPGLKVDFGQVIGDMLGDLMSSVQPIEVKIFGDNQQTLQILADSIAGIVSKVPGTADVFDGITIAGPNIRIIPKQDELLKYGMSPTDISNQISSKAEGRLIGSVLEKNKVVNIKLFEQGYAQTNRDFSSSTIMLKDGSLRPLSQFADVYYEKGSAEIDRENLKSMFSVTGRLNNRDLGSVLKDIKKELDAKIHLPQGFQMVYGGAFAQQQQAFTELSMILILAILLVFVVILFLFRKMNISLIILFISVLGMAGSVLALFITGAPLNVGSYTGIIMIVGIIGENCIFTYLQYNEARKAQQSKDEAIVFSISTRLRPKLMTALGTITALLPLAMGIGTGAQLHQPLAIAVIGGMVVALPLLLIVLPTMLHVIKKA
jgi:CzcA family heavy metal efflux pump